MCQVTRWHELWVQLTVLRFRVTVDESDLILVFRVVSPFKVCGSQNLDCPHTTSSRLPSGKIQCTIYLTHMTIKFISLTDNNCGLFSLNN